MKIRKLLVSTTIGLGVLVSASPAFAQDCFIVNRSDAGSTHVANSKVWDSFAVTDVFGLSGQCAAAVNAALTSNGNPTVLSTRIDKTLLEGTAADLHGKTADGKGVDHLEESPVIGQMIGVVMGVLSTSPACAA